MNKILEQVLERVKSWPEERQAEAARVLEAMEQSGTALYRLDGDERAAVEIGLDQSKRGELVSDAELAAFWNRNRAKS